MSVKTCPDTHTASPDGLAWFEWIERKMRTHYQEQCPDCGLWSIYKRRPKPLRKAQVEALLHPGDVDLDDVLDDRLTERERENLVETYAVEA